MSSPSITPADYPSPPAHRQPIPACVPQAAITPDSVIPHRLLSGRTLLVAVLPHPPRTAADTPRRRKPPFSAAAGLAGGVACVAGRLLLGRQGEGAGLIVGVQGGG